MMLISTSTSAYFKNCKAKDTLSFWEYFHIYMYVQAAYMKSVSWEPCHYISMIDLCLQKSQLLNIFKSSCCFLLSNCVDGRPNFTIKTKQFLAHWLVGKPWNDEMVAQFVLLFLACPLPQEASTEMDVKTFNVIVKYKLRTIYCKCMFRHYVWTRSKKKQDVPKTKAVSLLFWAFFLHRLWMIIDGYNLS